MKVDQEHEIDINFGLESYPGEGTLTIPSRPTSFSHKLRLQDQSKRKLQLAVNVTAQQGSGLKVCGNNYIHITSIPLLFKLVTWENIRGPYFSQKCNLKVSSFDCLDSHQTLIQQFIIIRKWRFLSMRKLYSRVPLIQTSVIQTQNVGFFWGKKDQIHPEILFC